MDFDFTIQTIKANLVRLLADMGGRAKMSEFGKAYQQRHGKIDLKVSKKN